MNSSESLAERAPRRPTRHGRQFQRSAGTLVQCVVLAGALGCGCSASPAAARSPHHVATATALIAQPCAAIIPVESDTSALTARVFVEVAHVLSGDLPEPVGPFLAEHAVPVDQVAGLLASNGIGGSTPWGECVDEACSSPRAILSVVPHLSGAASEPFEIELSITPATSGGQGQRFAARLKVTNQQPLVVPVGEQRVVVTPYLIGNDGDLVGLYQCKASQRDAQRGAG